MIVQMAWPVQRVHETRSRRSARRASGHAPHAAVAARIEDRGGRTLREPEQAQGDSMAERRSSSSSWQILHCRSDEVHASSCSIFFFLAAFSIPKSLSLSLSQPPCLSGRWLLCLCSLPSLTPSLSLSTLDMVDATEMALNNLEGGKEARWVPPAPGTAAAARS